jgi:2-keto-3-deoxy-L-rhamnonate aldolase RhmA
MKRALKAGQPQVGTMIAELRQPAVMQLLANAGFDFVIIDNEHGPFNIETIADLSRTALYVGLTPLVRIPDLAYPYIAQSLDAGAQGVMVPRITEAAQVREVVQMMKHPPLGWRGNALARGYSRFLSGSVSEVLAAVNEETLLVVQIETQQAIENLAEIVAVPGVDVALIGPSDLSISLGVPGQLDAPLMQEAIEATIAACQNQGVTPALHINNVELAVYWAKKGMQVLSSGSEAGLLVQAGQQLTGRLGEALGR